MIQRRLKALGYLEWNKVDANNPLHFRKVTVWLEDQKIRQYKIEDRRQLRDLQNENWQKDFANYCLDAGCPISGKPLDQLEWLMGQAIWLESVNGIDSCNQKLKEKKVQKKNEVMVPTIKSTNPLDKLDFHSPGFKNGVNSIAKLLRVPQHPNPSVTLKACSKVVKKYLNAESLKNPHAKIVRGKPFPVMDIAPGFNLSDKMLDNAAKGLALLYIQDIRDLQTRINEAIVSVQSITANPKTDTKLGKVGK